MNEKIIETQEHKDFQKLCKKYKLYFDPKYYGCVKFDSGGLFAFYSKVCEIQGKEFEKIIDNKLSLLEQHDDLDSVKACINEIKDLKQKLKSIMGNRR